MVLCQKCDKYGLSYKIIIFTKCFNLQESTEFFVLINYGIK
jgi:hypothetical protein